VKEIKTIKDVAALAGVSVATVGRVIGNYGHVSQKTRNKVIQAVQELNYYPNAIAQGMRNHSTKTIAVIVGSIKNNFFSEIVYAIERVARKQGYNVLICNTHEKEKLEIQHLEMLRSKQIDGIIIASSFARKQDIAVKYRYLYENEIPMVCIDRNIMDLDRDVIESEHFEGAYEATEYLLQLGHEKICVIGMGQPPTSTVRIRISGYEKALEDHQVSFDKNRVLCIDYEETVAQEEISDFFDRNGDMTAILVLNNSLCSGVLKEMVKRGLKCPDNLSLIGWDDEALNQILNITTVEQQISKIGSLAAERLFYLIENRESKGEHMVTTLKTHLLIRSSCKKIDR
jgi:LacI family transcriptional regulator